MNNPFVRFSTTAIFMFGWIIAWQQVLYASHLPGDSFTAAVILLIVILLHFVVLGQRTASEKLPLHLFSKSILTGIAILVFVAIAPLFSGKKMFEPLKVSIVGHELSSTLLFELAVLLVVVGVGAIALITFKEPD